MSHLLDPNPTPAEQLLAVEAARAYLDKAVGDGDFSPNIADSDGLVTYINGTSNEPPADLVQLRKEVAVALEGLAGIITSAVLQTAGKDEKAKHDPRLWEDPVKYGLGPFISGFASSVTSYKRDVVGLEIATQFLNILIDAVTEEGGALKAFQKFLEDQGDTIRIEGQNTEEGYRYACIGMIHEIFQIENEEWIYTPKIKMFFTSFTRKTFSVTSACASVEKVAFDFKVEKFVAPFKIETWRQDETFREQVDEFIKKYNKTQIEQSENYFDGQFNSRKV
jgi:hypothetical protein